MSEMGTVNESTNTAVEGLKNEASKATAGFEQFQTQMKAGADKAKDTMADAFAFSKDTAEALAKSGQIWATGFQDLSRQYIGMIESATKETMERLKALGSAKSAVDMMEMQASLLRGSAEKMITESSRFASAYVKLADEARGPIAARMATAAEKFGKSK